MADSLEEFRRKNRAQMERAKRALQYLGRAFIREISEELVLETPGFGNQYHATGHIPTGRLRGGYNFTRSPKLTTSKGWNALRGEEGPFSDYGRETVERIVHQIANERMGGISYIENDVAYGDQIVRGEENHTHIGPRNFPLNAALKQYSCRDRALQSLRGVF